ncbi:MAG: transglutaminase-like domain-containing protein [Candidatus Thorarchaeota archaeon]
MDFQKILDDEKYLSPTRFCDCDHPEIISKAKDLTQNDANTITMALSIFHFVRDQIKFMMCEFDTASGTLTKRIGDCGTKTNLQVALLRAVNIPARYHIAALRKESIKGLVSELLYQQSPDVILYHPWCECYLSEKWIACDTLLDNALMDGVYKRGIFTKDDIPTIDWDGESDLNTMTRWMIEDKGTLPSLDELVLKAQKESEELPIDTDQLAMVINESNEYTDSLREQ